MNGSGKHLNWSMSDELEQPPEPENAHDNVQFLVFCAPCCARCTSSGAAPFRDRERWKRPSSRCERGAAGDHLDHLGDVDRHLPADREGRKCEGTSPAASWTSASACCRSCTDAGDRNRTSRLRSPGTSSSSGRCRPTRHCAAEHRAERGGHGPLDYCATELEASLKSGKKLDEAVKLLLSRWSRRASRSSSTATTTRTSGGEGGQQARSAQPAELGRRVRRIAEAGCHQGVRAVRRAQRAS